MSNSGFYIRILNSLTLNRSEARITLHGVFDTDFFDLSFPMQRDSKRICKCDRLRLVLDHESPESHEYIPGRNLNNSLDSCD